MRIAGLSYGAIVKMLNEIGVPTARRKAVWSKGLVRHTIVLAGNKAHATSE
ncbi:MAG: recombinase family protein [Deltaproteobacteria bacterium]|nr:recombinase family protein [Deltaproteobacteria bacterium]